MVTRSVNEGATVHAPSPISNRPSLRCCLADASGYHSRGQRPPYTIDNAATFTPLVSGRVNAPMVTRSVNEGATVHAPSPISNPPSLRSCLADASGYWICGQMKGHYRGGMNLICRMEIVGSSRIRNGSSKRMLFCCSTSDWLADTQFMITESTVIPISNAT